jgi:hypothetical protein
MKQETKPNFYLALYKNGAIKVIERFFDTKNQCLEFFKEFKRKRPDFSGSFEIYDTKTSQEVYFEIF